MGHKMPPGHEYQQGSRIRIPHILFFIFKSVRFYIFCFSIRKQQQAYVTVLKPVLL